MAYVQNQSKDQDNEGQRFGQPQQIGPSAAPSGPNPQGFSSAPTVNAPTSSGRFTNISNYLNANKNFNQQGGGLAGKVSGTLVGEAQEQQRAIDQSKQDWYGANASKNIDPSEANRFVEDTIQNASSTNDPQTVARFQQYLNAGNTYVAPGAYDASQQLQQGVQGVQSLAGLTGSEAGRKTLLQSLYSTPFYGAGAQNLDNLILQAGNQQLPQLQSTAGNISSGLGNYYNNVASELGAAGAQYGQNAQVVQNEARKDLSNSITDFNNQANSQLQTVKNARNNQAGMAAAALARGEVTPDMLSLMKLPYSDMTILTNPGAPTSTNPATYFHPNTQTLTAQNVITPEAQARINSLNTLAGGNLSGDVSGILNQFAGNTKAGTADSTPYTFDAQGFTSGQGKAMADLLAQTQDVIHNSNLHEVYGAQPDWYNTLVNSTPYDAVKFLQSHPVLFGSPVVNQGIDSAIQRLNSLMSSYGVNPETGLGKTLKIIPNFNQNVSSDPNAPTLGETGIQKRF